MGKSIGRGIREFKGAMLDDEEPRRAPAPRAEEPVPPAPAPAAPTATMPAPTTTTSWRAWWSRATRRRARTTAPLT